MAEFSSLQLLGEKSYFRIGDVARIVGVKPYVLRYWETEFSVLKPAKTNTNQRLYDRKDVEKLLRIKDLLYREKLTIAGAKQRLNRVAVRPTESDAKFGDMFEQLKFHAQTLIDLAESDV